MEYLISLLIPVVAIPLLMWLFPGETREDIPYGIIIFFAIGILIVAIFGNV